MKLCWKTAALAVAIAAMLGGRAHAVLLAYDGFTTKPSGDYIIGENADSSLAGPDLSGQTGGTGTFFSGPWVAAGYPDTTVSPPQNTKVFAASLTRPGQINPSVGGSASNTPHFGDCCYESRTSRLMASPWDGFTDPDGTFYMSYLVNFGPGNNTDPQHRVFEMHDAGFDDAANRNLLLGFSSFVWSGTSYANNLTLAVRDSVTNTTTNLPLLADGKKVWIRDTSNQGTHLMVLKFQMSTSGNDTVSAFLDPVGTSEPAPNASITVGQFLADRTSTMVQFTYYDSSQRAAFDEMRVGTTFADVANNTVGFVPEPATLTLVGWAAVGLVLVARRKRG